MFQNKIVKRTYIQIKGHLASPLLAGSGEDNQTDADVLRDYTGQYFLAGTAIAGAFRHWLSNNENEEQIVSLFGDNETFNQSRIFVSDLKLENHESMRIVREHVKLKDKVTEDSGKFNVEAIATATQFTLRLEYLERESSQSTDENATTSEVDKRLITSIICAIRTGELCFGGKISRGYGKLSITEIKEKVFEYTNKKDVYEWLDWSWPQIEAVQPIKLNNYPEQSKNDEKITIKLTIPQTLLIREYQTTKEFDYTYLQANGKPVIPGTTWAGAFRQRLREIICDELGGTDEIVTILFGNKHGENGRASILRFEESVIENSYALVRTRNAIDRFSGATVEHALFTGESICKGDTKLTISWKKQSVVSSEAIKGMLNWLIQDLNQGFLAIGGETAVGRGVFEIIDQQPLEIADASYAKAAIDTISVYGGVKYEA